MKNNILAVLLVSASFLGLGANASAQVGKAASEATDAARHKIDEKRADDESKKSGPVGKAVTNVKSDYHTNRSKNSADKAKQSLKNAG